MAHFDIFNGDADGILSLLQLRKHQPLASTKITGVKRDIALLAKCEAQKGDAVTVLDISMAKNREPLLALLENEVSVFYADHHQSGSPPASALLDAHLDFSADTCTALIIDKLLGGRYQAWAIAAAFGDNLLKVADALCEQAGFTQTERDFLCELGILINYNGYGADINDLHFAPDDLFHLLMSYDSPFALLQDNNSPYFALKSAFEQDSNSMEALNEYFANPQVAVFMLPNDAISRRISGIFSNRLANEEPNKAHLVLTHNHDKSYTVSLRAPLNNPQGADKICQRFPTGGGRAGAAGINQLPPNMIDKLINETSDFYKSP